jgi:hypothetical protein
MKKYHVRCRKGAVADHRYCLAASAGNFYHPAIFIYVVKGRIVPVGADTIEINGQVAK